MSTRRRWRSPGPWWRRSEESTNLNSNCSSSKRPPNVPGRTLEARVSREWGWACSSLLQGVCIADRQTDR